MLTHLVLRKDEIKKDWRLHTPGPHLNYGRKMLVNQIYPETEIAARNSEWQAGSAGTRTPVVETGIGGVEIATFNETTAQEYHKHLRATEIYLVLEGAMGLRLDDHEVVLQAGDQAVVFPGTPHEIKAVSGHFLACVHVINCYGEEDKYVPVNGEWMQVTALKKPGGSQQSS